MYKRSVPGIYQVVPFLHLSVAQVHLTKKKGVQYKNPEKKMICISKFQNSSERFHHLPFGQWAKKSSCTLISSTAPQTTAFKNNLHVDIVHHRAALVLVR